MKNVNKKTLGKFQRTNLIDLSMKNQFLCFDLQTFLSLILFLILMSLYLMTFIKINIINLILLSFFISY